MTDLSTLKRLNAERWANAKLTRGSELTPAAKKLVAAKARYQAVEAKTGVPWFVIAVIHQRESSQSWTGSLAQGDPWNKVSTHVPAGRGPFPSWEAAAVDALVSCAPYAARNKDWSPAGALTMLEQYNGLKYASEGVPSPYVWSGTDQYKIGKVTRDHGPIEPVVDKQLGCAGMILAMKALDPSITFGTPTTKTPDAPIPTKEPEKTAGKTAVVVGGVIATSVAVTRTTNWQTAAVVIVAGIIIVAAILVYWSRRK